MEITTISQDVLDTIHEEHEKELKELKKKGNLTNQEMILLYNILTNLYDSFNTEIFGCSKQEYRYIINRLDALTY